MANVMQQQWDQNWNSSSTPWEPGTVDRMLVSYCDNNPPINNVLEIGCGSGINSNFLAERGYTVTAIDIAQTAIDNAKLLNSKINFVAGDVLKYVPNTTYDFIFDRGCYHCFTSVEDQILFINKIKSLLVEGGHWLTLIGAVRDANSFGPPQHALVDIVTRFEPHFKILEIKNYQMQLHKDLEAPAWAILLKNRGLHETNVKL